MKKSELIAQLAADICANGDTEHFAFGVAHAQEATQLGHQQAVKLLKEMDSYLREIRAENLDGSEPVLGELLDKTTAFWIALKRLDAVPSSLAVLPTAALTTALRQRGYGVSVWGVEDVTSLVEADCENLTEDRIQWITAEFLGQIARDLEDALGERGNDYTADRWQALKQELIAAEAKRSHNSSLAPEATGALSKQDKM